MSTIIVSFSNCKVNCPDPSTADSPTVAWLIDSTVASIDSIDNFSPNPFQPDGAPTSPNWVGTLLPDWKDKSFTYTITITPSNPGKACTGPYTKTPTIKVSAW